MKKLLSFIATTALLFNSLAAPLSVFAQDLPPTPTPEATVEPTSTPDPTIEPTPTPETTPTPEPTITPEPSTTPEPTPTPSWDKSSLYFDEDFACQGSCTQLKAKVCNKSDSEDMQGTSTWELYYIEKGNPKNGELISSETINTLESGKCQELTYTPTANGNYKFKGYQRFGHPGTGELWSDTCSISACFTGILGVTQSIEESPTPEPTESPLLTPTPSIEPIY